jgi:hypothetical protein
LKERSLSTFYDEVAVKGLQLAQADVMRNALGPDRVERIRATLTEVMEELGDREEKDNEGVTEDTEAAAAVESIPEENGEDRRIEPDEIAPGWEGEAPVLCIGGRNALDEASAFMLAQLLGRRGVGARAEPSTQGIGPLRGTTGVAMVALCYLDGLSLSHMRFTVRRLRRRLPGVPILLGCWTVERNDLNGETLRETVRANLVATELGTAVNLIVDHATGRAEKSEASAPAPRALTRGAA